MKRFSVFAVLLLMLASASAASGQTRGPVIVVETTKGTFEFETYPAEAPLTVVHVVTLIKDGFYDGQRVHRMVPGFVVQWGDPRSRDLAQDADWGSGADASSGSPIGAAETSKLRTHTKGAVGIAHPGNPTLADSQIYVTLEDRPELDRDYTVFGRIVTGDEVVATLERGDAIRKMYVKE